MAELKLNEWQENRYCQTHKKLVKHWLIRKQIIKGFNVIQARCTKCEPKDYWRMKEGGVPE